MLGHLCNFFLRLGHWKAVGSFPPSLKKAVVIIAPHTSGRDMIICLAFRKALHLERFKFIGKKELFRPPFGFLFRWVGGIPADRSISTNLVTQVVHCFEVNPEFIIALSPEGTRKKVDRLRTGFYHIAKKAAVPIVMIGLDYGKKQLEFAAPFYAGNDEKTDLGHVLSFFGLMKGRHPEMGLEHLLNEQLEE